MLGLFIRSGEELHKDLYVTDQQEILYTAPWYKEKKESCLTKKKEKTLLFPITSIASHDLTCKRFTINSAFFPFDNVTIKVLLQVAPWI